MPPSAPFAGLPLGAATGPSAEGSMFLLYAAMTIYLLAVIGIGLFISSMCSTQQQAIIGVFMFIAPAILLSGYAFPCRTCRIGCKH